MIPQIMPPVGQRAKTRPVFGGQNPQALAKPGGFQPPPGGGMMGAATDVAMRTPGTLPPQNTPSLSAGGGGGMMTPYTATQNAPPLAMDATARAPAAPGMTPQSSGTRNMFVEQRNAANPMPQQGGNVNPAWNPQGGVSPFNATSGSTGVGDFQRFADASYDRQAARLTPQFEAQQRGFEQDMVNRGIAPGTPAYDNARQNFEQSRNDAFEGARTQADQLGAALQQQSFGQGQVNSQGLRELILGQLAADTSRQNTSTSAAASRYGADSAANTAANNLAYQQQQGDFGNLMQLLGFGLGATGQNNAAQGQNYNQNASMLGMIPGMQQPNNIDVTSGYNNQYNAGLNQSQYNQQQQNSNNQMYAQMFASMYCDRDAKDEIAAAAPEDALTAITSLPYATWTYKADVEQVPHVGTYAQDFNAALGLPANLTISPIDLMGALIGSVQALTARIKELETA